MTQSVNPSVFISYDEADLSLAKKLYQNLKQAGVTVWFDKESLLPGQNVKLVEKQAIKEHSFFIVLLSEHSVKPGRVIRQINWALEVSDEMPEYQIHIIPVKLSDCLVPHTQLSELDFVELATDWKAGLAKILAAIGVVGKPDNMPPESQQPSTDARGHVDSFSNASAPRGPIQNRWALLVGINRYVDNMFPTLKFCINDVTELKKTLKGLGYTVICLHDNAVEERLLPTRDNIKEELQRLCRAAGPDDLLLVHFAGHGKLIQGNALLITREIRQFNLAEKALPVAQIEKLMKTSKARCLFLSLDACHTGLDMGRDIADPEFIRNVHDQAQGYAMIAASTSQQIAQECQDKQHGVYSWFLLDGLNGKADRDRKGFVTFDDLKKHVLNGLKIWGVEKGLIQEPTAKTEGMGDMIIADFRNKAEPVLDMSNPFGDVGKIETPERFFDREELMRRIFEELNKGANISLVGDSQIGKSSVLSMICQWGPEKLNLPPENFLYLTMEWVDDEDDFYELLCEELKITVCRGGKLARALRGKQYIFCLDEAEKMQFKGFSFNVRSHLRGLADGSAAPLRLVIASRAPLDTLFSDSPAKTSPLAGICMKMELKPFSSDTAQAFIAHRLKPTGICFSDGEMEALLKESGGHPAKLQRAAAELFEKYRDQR